MTRDYPVLRSDLPEPTRPISFVCVRFSDEFRHNIKTSRCISREINQFITIDNRKNLIFDTLGSAINEGIARARHDLIAVVHEDVVLPDHWQAQFEHALTALERDDPDWFLLGAAGWTESKDFLGHLSDPHGYRNTLNGALFAPVHRLDEQLLVFDRRRLANLDGRIPSIHVIGRDLACRGRQKQLATYALDAPTIHKFKDDQGKEIQTRKDSTKIQLRKDPIYIADRLCSHRYFEQKWDQPLPIPFRGRPSLPDVDPAVDAAISAPVIVLDGHTLGAGIGPALIQDCGVQLANGNLAPDLFCTLSALIFSTTRYSASGLIPGFVKDLRRAAAHFLTSSDPTQPWSFHLPEASPILHHLHSAFPKARYLVIERDPEHRVLRHGFTHNSADTQMDQAVLVGAYDHFGLPREMIQSDTRMLRTAVAAQYFEARQAAPCPRSARTGT